MPRPLTAVRLARAHRAARGALLCLAILLSAALVTGCVAFPHGAYWPRYESHLAPSAGPAGAGAAPVPDWSSPVQAEALRGRLRGAVARRWQDEGLADSARAMGAGAGKWVYGSAMQTLVWFYVDPVTYGDLVVSGIESLRVALDDQQFCACFAEAADAEKRAQLAAALEILSLKARAAHITFSWQATRWLDVALEKNRAILGLPDGAVVAEFLFGATDALDPYTRFLTPEMHRGYRREMAGVYTGIGAEVVVRGTRVVLGDIFADGGAAKAGLATGDEIVRIGSDPVAGLGRKDVSRRLRGKQGTPVVLLVRTGGEGDPRPVTVVRSRVHVPSVRGVAMLADEPGTGYLRLTSFKSGTERELRKGVADLSGRGARRLVLDLRGNPGGALLEAIGTAGVFLDGGRVIETRGRTFGATWKYDVPVLARQAWAGPLVVLVDGRTASAAEVLAAALARHKRARLVGERTYGKGAAQIYMGISGAESAVSVTVARVYGPDDVCIEGTGLAPDEVVASPAEAPACVADDPVVRAAVEMLCRDPVLSAPPR